MRRNIGEDSAAKEAVRQEVYEALLDLRKQAKVSSIWSMIDFKIKKFNKETEKKVLEIYKSKVYNWTRKRHGKTDSAK